MHRWYAFKLNEYEALAWILAKLKGRNFTKESKLKLMYVKHNTGRLKKLNVTELIRT
jgi:hypothetical protein